MRMSRLFPLLAPLLFLPLASAPALGALDPSLATKFYKSPRSLFHSGEANQRLLEKNWAKDYSDFSYLVHRENRKFWVRAASVARDLQLSQAVFSSRTQKQYKVLQTAGASILGKPIAGPGSPEWLPLSELSSIPSDTGVVMTLTHTQLRQGPNWKSDSLLSVPPATRLKVLKIEDSWAQVSFESVGKTTGWVDLNNLLFKHDFASFIMTKSLRWTPVLYREGSDMVTTNKTRVPLNEVIGLVTKPDLGISLVTSDSEKLLLRQNLTLVKTEFQVWSMSRLEGHGEVFWKKKQNSTLLGRAQSKGLGIDELIKKEIASVSFHPKNPHIAIVSAQGIYITTDGKSWKHLAQFGQQNHPVLVDANSNFYVGTQRSLDGGKSFSHYFKLTNLAALIEKRQQSPAQHLKVKNLTSPRPGVLRLEVETAKGSLAFAARTSSEPIAKWDFD